MNIFQTDELSFNKSIFFTSILKNFKNYIAKQVNIFSKAYNIKYVLNISFSLFFLNLLSNIQLHLYTNFKITNKIEKKTAF